LENTPLSFDTFVNAQFQLTDAAALRRRALTGRSDVQGLLAEYRAAESAVRLEVAKQYPNLLLGPGYTFDTGNQAYELTLAAAAELPIFNQNQGPLAEAEARRRGVGTQLLLFKRRLSNPNVHYRLRAEKFLP
jgi:outer membrane protein TolC